MSASVSVQPFLASRKRVSRGFHRLGIFLGLLTLLICLIIGAQQYDPVSVWMGGLFVAPVVYGLSRLAGWTINGFVEPEATASTEATATPAVFPVLSRPVSLPIETTALLREEPQPSLQEKLKGVKGWLVIPIAGLLLAPLKIVAMTFLLVRTLYGLSADTEVSVRSMLVAEIAANIGIAILITYAIVQFVGRKRTFPMTYIALFAISIVVMVADAFLVYFFLDLRPDNKDMRDAFLTIIAFAVWAPYMLYSKRVQNTFVN